MSGKGKAEIVPAGNTTRIGSTELPVEMGEWFWIKETVQWDGQWTREEVEQETGVRPRRKLKKGETVEWLGCVMEIGSNYVELRSPPRGRHRSSRTTRVHFDNFWTGLRHEPDAERIIRENAERYQAEVNRLLGEVRAVTERLGMVPTTDQISDQARGSANALAVISSEVDTTAYKTALTVAKDKQLPDLFKAIEEAHENLAAWMAAPSLPILATIGPMRQSIGRIEDRLYTIELYAGLTEDAVQCSEGQPAAMGAKLHVMQRRLYMDEECLLNYQAGGMEFRGIGAFDAWIAEPENRDRLLPFPRTLAAFRVRRKAKEREDGGHAWRAFVNIQEEKADQATFLYIRNGEQVWRVTCDFEFDEMIFPHSEQFDPSEPMMAKMYGDRVDKMMSLREWEHLVQERDRNRAEYARKAKAWVAESEDNAARARNGYNPFSSYYDSHGLDAYQPVDRSSVYFDEAREFQRAEIKRYNRVAVIIQGLFDRSPVLHPHPRVKVWTAEGFESAVELVRDAATLTFGDPPNFEAYRAHLNSKLRPDSIVTGQQDYWLRKEAEKENRRQANDWRNRERSRSNYTRYHPYGNPGPGLLARMHEWKARAGVAVFRWEREAGWRSSRTGIPCKLNVPAAELLNVSAYEPGDYKQFFQDPRTRQDYLKWAPLMLAAEDYHAGKGKLGENARSGGDRWER